MEEEDSTTCPNGGMIKSHEEEKTWPQRQHAHKMPWQMKKRKAQNCLHQGQKHVPKM